MSKLPNVPAHHVEATGGASKLRINKSSGPLSPDNTPKSNGTIKLDPYRGKK